MDDITQKLDALAREVSDLRQAEGATLNANNRITVRSAWTIITVVTAGCFFYWNGQQELRERVLVLQQDVLHLRKAIESQEASRREQLTKTMFRDWVRQANEWLRAHEITLPVPGGN